LTFAGRPWIVKKAASFGPGPNCWSDKSENVRLESDGLHLRITHDNGQWCAAEVILNQSLGYGTYRFDLKASGQELDPQVVLGLFLYDYLDPTFAYREIDVELTRGFGVSQNGHYAVQCSSTRHDFDFSLIGSDSTHTIEWKSTGLTFSSSGNGSGSFQYTGPCIPPPGAENIRINLWLLDGSQPTDGQEVEVVMTHFEFIP
jgi:hypothetical protein